jgi:hypothetical protein
MFVYQRVPGASSSSSTAAALRCRRRSSMLSRCAPWVVAAWVVASCESCGGPSLCEKHVPQKNNLWLVVEPYHWLAIYY